MAGLYIHIPFCDQKCIYCDFYSLPRIGDVSEDERRQREFRTQLEREIDLQAGALGGKDVETIFFGGGTPSLLLPEVVGDLLGRLRSRFAVSHDAEITLESNPGTVDEARLRDFRSAGINRLSIGVQSFHDDELRFLTRIHTAAQAEDSIEAAWKSGFTNVNLDLIFALPGQTPQRWRETLERAVRFRPQHLSCYSLTVEPNTMLANMVAARQVVPLSSEMDADLYEQTASVLAQSGYSQYEVSNYARPGFRCRHNLIYWSHGEYLGFGPSAHSFLGGRRWWNVRSLSSYGQALERGELPVAGEETLSPEELMVEEMFLGLRSTGIDMPAFRLRHNRFMPRGFERRLRDLLGSEFARSDGKRLWLTAKGYMMCDELCAVLAAEGLGGTRLNSLKTADYNSRNT